MLKKLLYSNICAFVCSIFMGSAMINAMIPFVFTDVGEKESPKKILIGVSKKISPENQATLNACIEKFKGKKSNSFNFDREKLDTLEFPHGTDILAVQNELTPLVVCVWPEKKL